MTDQQYKSPNILLDHIDEQSKVWAALSVLSDECNDGELVDAAEHYSLVNTLVDWWCECNQLKDRQPSP